MAKGSMLMGTAGGKLGEMVLYRAYGQQIARAYVNKIKDAKSDGQVDQRAKFAITGAMFAGSGIKFFPKRTKGTNYNEFLKKNVTNVQYWQSKQEIDFAKANGLAPFETFILADGSMANLLGLTTSFSQQSNMISSVASLLPEWYNRYLNLFAEGETTAQVSIAQIIRDYVAEKYGSMYVHPTIAAGEVCDYDAIGVVTQSKLKAFDYITAFEFVPEDLSDSVKVTLTCNEGQTAITDITGGQLTIDTAKSIEIGALGSGTSTRLYFKANLPTPATNRSGVYADVFVVRRIGGFDSSRLQIDFSHLTTTSETWGNTYAYPRQVAFGDNDAIYIENWRAAAVADDSEVLAESRSMLR